MDFMWKIINMFGSFIFLFEQFEFGYKNMLGKREVLIGLKIVSLIKLSYALNGRQCY